MARKIPVHSGYTIINGSGIGSNGGRIDVWVEYTLADQSITGNYTPVTAYFYAALNENYTSSTANVRGLNSSFSISGIAGAAVSSGAYDFTSPQKVNFLGSFSGNIPHNSDGTKTIAMEGSFTTLSSYISGGSVSAVVTLPTIARASAITAEDAAIEDTARVTVSRYAAGFTHSIQWQFGDLSGYLAQDGSMVDGETVFSQTQLDVALPESFYEQIPDAPDGVCTLTCRTYQGSDFIGESTCDFAVRADRSLCSPTVSGTVEDCDPATLALTGNKYILVSGRSDALCTVTAQAKNGASITQLTDPHIIEDIATGTVQFAATDSRGYTATYGVTLPLIPYISLSCDASVKRTDPTSGNAVLTLSGQCYLGSFGAVDNALTITCRAGEQTWTVTPTVGIDNSYYTTVTLGGLDYTQAHTLTITAADCLDTVNTTVTVQKGQPVFDWGEGDFQFHVPVGIQGDPVADFVIEQGSDNVWHWTKWKSGKAECYGLCNYGEVPVTTAWGSVYQSERFRQALPTGLFATAPKVVDIQYGMALNGYFGWVAKGDAAPTADSTGEFFVVRATPATMQQLQLSFHVIGSWK